MSFLKFVQTLGFLVEKASMGASVTTAGELRLGLPDSIRFEIFEERFFDFSASLGIGEGVDGTGGDGGLKNPVVSNYTDIEPEMLPLGVHEASIEFLGGPILQRSRRQLVACSWEGLMYSLTAS